MVKTDYMTMLQGRLAELLGGLSLCPHLRVEQYVDDTCRIRFPKDIANTRRDAITLVAEEMAKTDGIKEMSDTWRDTDVFRGSETRDVYLVVSRKHWSKTKEDREWWERENGLLEDDDKLREKLKQEREEKRKYSKEYLIPIPRPSASRPAELYLTMAYEPYDLIKSGEKVTEFRAYCETWVKRILANMGTLKTVKFQRGYGGPGRPKPEQMVWTIKNIELYDIETRESSDPLHVKDGFIPTHIAIDLGIRADDVGRNT